MTWQPAVFSPNSLAGNAVVELAIATQTDLLDLGGGRSTIGQIYGSMTIIVEENQTTLDQATGAWGIRLKEADATTTTTAFSPLADGDSTDWITLRQYAIWKQYAGTNPTSGNPTIFHHVVFNIRNLRKSTPDQELVCIIHNSSTSNDIRYFFECRAALILP